MKPALTALVLVSACLLLFLVVKDPQPVASQTASTTIQLAGLKEPVTVRRDERGIPYIDAKNDEDLYFAQGYITASDRLWQMDLYRRTARGELAEVLGAGPNNAAIDQDKLHRVFGFGQVAEAEATQASPKARAVLEAYAKGVNAYAASLTPKTMPPEFQILNYGFRPWTAADSLVVVKIFFEALSTTWQLDLMRQSLASLPADKRAALLPETSPLDVLVVGKDTKPTTAGHDGHKKFAPLSAEALTALAQAREVSNEALARIGFYAESLAASNNWVVSGKRTASGKPLLANDPHLRATAPSIWYLVHLNAPGVRVAGVTTPGLPGVIIGHNDHIAWGFTNVGPDVQDLYLEKFDPNDPKKYLTPGGWQEATIRHEEIKVKGADSIGLDVTVTRHGPIVFEGDGKRYALRWTGLDPKLSNAENGFLLNRARNWKEFNDALEAFKSPTQNVVYADVDGHIGYHAAGVVPVRKSGDGSVPYDGTTDDGEWTSFIPLAKLPQLYDPPSGMIVTANQRIVGTDFPHFLTHSWAQPYRSRRIFDLLNAKQKLTADDFRRIQGDVYSIAGVLFAQETVKALRPKLTAEDQKLRAYLDAVEKWDGNLTAESNVGALLA
ncbi:MAG TPA: penicillin acylase family protein, partial [Pyrinomonadaceae bacterium]|nr:penicillin acylase family protein [Pyrinomonadaceae bacterium]